MWHVDEGPVTLREEAMTAPDYRLAGPTDEYSDVPPGAGWLFFAGTVLGLAGLMRIIDAIWAFRYSGQLPAALEDGVLGSNLNTYAWTWLIVGILLLLASGLLLTGSQIARWFGVLPGLVADVHRRHRARLLRPRPVRRSAVVTPAPPTRASAGGARLAGSI
jgi:hypothetical protein